MSIEEHDRRNWFTFSAETDRINRGEGGQGNRTVVHSINVEIGEKRFSITAMKDTESKSKKWRMPHIYLKYSFYAVWHVHGWVVEIT